MRQRARAEPRGREEWERRELFFPFTKIGRGMATVLLGLVVTAGGGSYNNFFFNLGNPNPFSRIPLNGGNFRVPDSTGTAIGRPQFSNAVLTYREIRLGGGLRLKLLPFAAVQTEAGEALGRDVDYYRVHENLKVNNAP